MKKIYTKPSLIEHNIDSDISLILMSRLEEPPNGDPFATSSSGTSQPEQLKQNSFDTNPFEEK